MKKVIHKSFFKRGTAILLALVCLISAICLVPINAASREVTITFDYAYDTGGNIIGFVQYTEHDGYVVGTAGEELCTIQADGDDAYCIEPGHSLYSGNTLTTDASAAWNALSKAQKKAVNLALLFGKSGNGANLGGTEGQKWIATQLVVWEFCTGCRDASTFKLKNSKFIDGITAGDNNPGVKSNYNKIIAKLNDYNVIPSFAYETQANAKRNVKEMKYSDGKYTLTLTESNGMLSDYAFKKTGDVSVSISGNKITLTSSKAIDSPVVFSAEKKMPKVTKPRPPLLVPTTCMAICCWYMAWRMITFISRIARNMPNTSYNLANSSTCRSIPTATIASSEATPVCICIPN